MTSEILFRQQELKKDLTARLAHIWIGDYGGFEVRVNLDGPPALLDSVLQHQINSRPDRESIKPGYYRGYPTFEYASDIQLLRLRKDWVGLEHFLKKLVETESNDPESVAPFVFEELAKLYRKQKRFPEEVNLLRELENLCKSRGQSMAERLSSRLDRAESLSKRQ